VCCKEHSQELTQNKEAILSNANVRWDLNNPHRRKNQEDARRKWLAQSSLTRSWPQIDTKGEERTVGAERAWGDWWKMGITGFSSCFTDLSNWGCKEDPLCHPFSTFRPILKLLLGSVGVNSVIQSCKKEMEKTGAHICHRYVLKRTPGLRIKTGEVLALPLPS
jgi:hypothetical protein